jgi:amidase
MARHVKDLRLALEVMSGPDARDPWWTPAPLVGPSQNKPIKVAVTTNPGKGGVVDSVAAGILKAAEVLSDSGYEVEEVEPPAIAEAKNLWVQLTAADIRETRLAAIKEFACPDILTFLDYFLESEPKLNLKSYIQALGKRLGVARKWTQFAEKYHLVLGPVSTNPPFSVGYDIAGKTEVQNIINSMRLTVTVNLLGLPSVAVPVGIAGGVPQGVQLIGPRYREDLCLDAAEVIENQLGKFTPIDPI